MHECARALAVRVWRVACVRAFPSECEVARWPRRLRVSVSLSVLPAQKTLAKVTGQGLLVSLGKVHARHRRIIGEHFQFANLKV
jgi:hypothetical protein